MSLTAQPLTEFEISQRGALVEFISLANPLLVAEFAGISSFQLGKLIVQSK